MAANAIVKLITTKAASLSKLEVKNGQLIFVSDTRHIYLDFNGMRVCYECINVLSTNQERLNLLAPIEGFYFVKDTGVLWSFSEQWQQITPDNLDQIIFGETADDFPKEGNSKILYTADDGVYKWDSSSNTYKVVANLTEWKDF